MARTVAIVAVLAAAAFVALGGGSDPRPGRDTTALTLSATDLVAAATSTHGAATGGYVPGTGVVVAVTVETLAPEDVRGLVTTLLEPQAAVLSSLPGQERVVVVVDALAPTPFTRIVQIAPDVLAFPDRWSVIATAHSAAAIAATQDLHRRAATATSLPEPSSTAPAAMAPSADAPAAAASAAETEPATPAPAAGSTATATADPAAATPAGTGTTFETDDDWSALSGTWAVADGAYVQSDGTGFDYIAQFLGEIPDTYSLSVRMQADAGPLNAGVILGQPAKGARDGATIVDLTAEGTYLRWGRYGSPGGAYEFIGGATLASPITDAGWHTLRIDVLAAATRVYLDDQLIGEFGAVAPGGLGLVTSQAVVRFDDLTITPGS